MTVASEAQKVTANGNDVATVFSFSPLVIYQNSDLTVTHVSAAGVETLLTEGAGATNYSVTIGNQADFDAGVGSTGSITYPASGGTPLATGASIVMKPVYSLLQQLDLENQGGYFADLQETAFDKLHRIAIQHQEEIDRSVKVTIGSGDDPDTLVTTIINAEASASASAAAAATAETNAETAETNAAASAAAAAAAVEAAGLPTPVADTILIRNAGNTDYVATNAAGTRTFLSLVVGTNVQAFHALLTSLSGLTVADDDLILGASATTLKKLAIGTEGQVPKVVSGALAYADETGGAWQEISRGTFSAASTLDIAFTPSSWAAIRVLLLRLTTSTTAALQAHATDDNFATILDSAAAATGGKLTWASNATTTASATGHGGATALTISENMVNDGTVDGALDFTLFDPNRAQLQSCQWKVSHHVAGTSLKWSSGGGWFDAENESGTFINGIRFSPDAGTFTGRYIVLGLAEP